jgi:prepilin-type N-terminal cleavage/methylation domain-containing protein
VGARGFTLLELVVVTALLALVAAVAVPRLSGAGADAGRARLELQTLLRLLRAEAAGSSRLYRLRLEAGSAQCVPEVLEGDRFVPLESVLLRKRRLSVDRIVEVLAAGGPSVAVHVMPSGFVEPALVEVETGAERHTLSIHALTGKVEVRPGPARDSGRRRAP